MPSTQVPGLNLVQPGNHALSYLFEKVNAHQPQVGVRMRPGTPMSLAEQALIRDWINQGALASAPRNNGGKKSDSGGCAVAGAAPPVAALAVLALWGAARRRRIRSRPDGGR